MLRVEVVSANNIRRNYAWLTLEAAVNGTQALAPERKCSGTLGICEINKQFFVPQKHQTQDIVFVAKLYQTQTSGEVLEQCTATLTASFMADLAKMAGVVKNLAFKPVNGMTLRLRLDYHASFHAGPEEGWSDLSKGQRYERLHKEFSKLLAIRGGGGGGGVGGGLRSPAVSPPPSPRVSQVSDTDRRDSAPPAPVTPRLQPPSPRVSQVVDVDRRDSAPPARMQQQQPPPHEQVTCTETIRGVVVTLFAAVGEPLLYGSPVCEIAEDEDAVELSTLLQRESSDGSGVLQSEYSLQDAHGAEPAAAQYSLRESYGSAYSPATASAQEAGELTGSSGRRIGLQTSKRSVPVAARRATVRWLRQEPGLVSRVCVELDGFVRTGQLLAHVDTSHKAQQQALLMAADRVAFDSRDPSATGQLNWRFQKLADQLASSIKTGSISNVAETMQCCNELERVARDFYETARTYGRVIINEMHLPVEAKTVRPLKLGGVLGGHKYVVRGVLFKIPNGEMFSAYPDPFHIANKVQGHELKGLRAYFGWFFNRGSLSVASFPLAAVIDFKGHRITAMTQLPIKGSETLIYGADDAGTECTVNNKLPSWSVFVKEASMGLNLKPHWAVNGRSRGGEIEIASCVDLEGHSGSDGRMYLLDFSRTFPPAFKDKETCDPHDNLWPFYHMLRAEFVARWEKPLCADSYSNFQSRVNEQRIEEAKHSNRETRAATEALRTDTVMRVCKALIESSDSTLSLTHVLHRFGLNMRYLGLVYAQLVSKSMYSATFHNLYTLIQVEAMMRVVKNHLRSQLRKTQTLTTDEDSESRLLAMAAATLNVFFGKCENRVRWRELNPYVADHLMKDFNFSEMHMNQTLDSFFRSYSVREVSSLGAETKVDIKYAVLARLNNKAGLGLRPELLQELLASDHWGGRSFMHAVIFEDLDFEFEERLKSMDVMERAAGVRHVLKGRELMEQWKFSMAEEHLLRAHSTLETAIEANPSDLFLCMLMGDACSEICEVMRLQSDDRTTELLAEKTDKQEVMRLAERFKVANLFQERAESYYRYAAQLDGRSTLAQRKMGFFLARRGQSDEAELYLLKALELGCQQELPVDGATLLALVAVLEKREDHETAGSLVEFFKYVEGLQDEWISRQRASPPPLPPMRVDSLSSVQDSGRARSGSFFRKGRGTVRGVAGDVKSVPLPIAADAFAFGASSGSGAQERDSPSLSSSPRRSPPPLRDPPESAAGEKLLAPTAKSPRSSSKLFFHKSAGKLK